MQFPVVLRSDKTGIVVAECPSIPGCITQGADAADAANNMSRAIRVCVEARTANGLPVTVPPRKSDDFIADDRLPTLSGEETWRALERAGWRIALQRDEHTVMVGDPTADTVCIPQVRELARETLFLVLQAAGLTTDAFLKLL